MSEPLQSIYRRSLFHVKLVKLENCVVEVVLQFALQLILSIQSRQNTTNCLQERDNLQF